MAEAMRHRTSPRMRVRPAALAALVTLLAALLPPEGPAAAQPDAQGVSEGFVRPRVLILHASSADPASRDYARLHALMLRNLLGRYEDLAVEIRDAGAYREGDAGRHLRTFYLGSLYGAPVPDALLRDVAAGAAVTWAGYGVWEVDRVEAGLAALGLRYETIRGSGAAPGDPGLFLDVRYRDHVFRKNDAATDAVELQVLRSGIEVPAWVSNARGERIPYVLRSGAFWHVADVPFTYIHETDRYLVFADLLGPMLGRAESCEPRAVVRVEDVDPRDEPEVLKRAFDLLAGEGIPFGVAVIPTFASNVAAREGRPEARVTWDERPEALAELQRAVELGGRVFQHGTTHQVPGFDNPDGVTGVDWEFWDVEANAPLAGSTVDGGVARVRDGRATLRGLGLEPVGWVTPHYAFDPAMGPALTEVYPVAFERRQYGSGPSVTGQLFPFPVRDVYGARIVPENGGSIQPDHQVAEVLAAARANRALRCPWFGFFFHPEILAPGFEGASAASLEEVRGMVREIRTLGFRFVDPLEAVGRGD